MTTPTLSGMPCDANHPFPAPGPGDRIDSMDYGADERRAGSEGMFDIELAPTWRAVAAWLWQAPCLDIHMAQLAEDPYLTTHLVAAAVIVGLPRNSMLEALALQQVGAAGPINAMQSAGLESATQAVMAMPLADRKSMIAECLAVVLKGWTTLQMDISDQSIRGVHIGAPLR